MFPIEISPIRPKDVSFNWKPNRIHVISPVDLVLYGIDSADFICSILHSGIPRELYVEVLIFFSWQSIFIEFHSSIVYELQSLFAVIIIVDYRLAFLLVKELICCFELRKIVFPSIRSLPIFWNSITFQGISPSILTKICSFWYLLRNAPNVEE